MGEYVMVPREQLQAAYDETMDTRYHQEWMCAILTRPAEEHRGEPVAWVHPAYLKPGAIGFEASVTRLADAQVPLYTHADPGEVERLARENKMLRSNLAEVDRISDEIQQERDALRAKLAERDALLRDLLMENISPRLAGCIEVALSASAEPSAPVERDEQAAVEEIAKLIYENWAGQPDYVPWVDSGNSLKQDEARRQARAALERMP